MSCHVSPPSLLQVYQSARVDGLLIFSIIPTKLKTAGECPPGVSVARLLFAPYSTFLVPPPVYAKEGYGGGISMDGFKHMLLGEAPEASYHDEVLTAAEYQHESFNSYRH